MQTQRSINLDRGWRFGTGSFNPMLDIVAQHFHAGDAPRIVDLPHDYMIESDVSADAPAGAASGFYTAGPAYYTRLVDIPAAWAGQEVFLQLDGAMMNATVEVNGSRAALQHNGYIPFAVRLTPYLTFGEENRITVNLNPSMQPKSRWYTGRMSHGSSSRSLPLDLSLRDAYGLKYFRSHSSCFSLIVISVTLSSGCFINISHIIFSTQTCKILFLFQKNLQKIHCRSMFVYRQISKINSAILSMAS